MEIFITKVHTLSEDNQIKRALTEEDEPSDFLESRPQVSSDKRFEITKGILPKINKDDYNTVKGHYLLGWCVTLIIGIYIFEFFFHKGAISEIGKDVLEIMKLLMFSLTGYLFGTSGKEKDK